MVKRGGGNLSSCMAKPADPSCTPPNKEVLAETRRIENALMLNSKLNALIEKTVEIISSNVEFIHLGNDYESKIREHKNAIEQILKKLPDSVIIGTKKSTTVSKKQLTDQIDILIKAYQYRNVFINMINKNTFAKILKITDKSEIIKKIKETLLLELNKTHLAITQAFIKTQKLDHMQRSLNTDDTVIKHINVSDKYSEEAWRNAIIKIVKYCEAFRIRIRMSERSRNIIPVHELLKYIAANFFPQTVPQTEESRVGGNNIKKLLKKVDLTRVPKVYLIKKNDYKKQNIRVLESPMYATIKLLKNKETQGIRVDDAFVKWLEKKTKSLSVL